MLLITGRPVDQETMSNRLSSVKSIEVPRSVNTQQITDNRGLEFLLLEVVLMSHDVND